MSNPSRKILESIIVSILIGLLSYFLLDTFQETGDFKSIKVYLAEKPTIDQPWSIYYHGRTGYTTLGTQEAIANGAIFSFSIKTTNTFSKIRLDPGSKKNTQEFMLVQVDLTVNEKVVHTFAAADLHALSKPLNHIESMEYNPVVQGVQIKTTKKGDPQLEIKISDADFINQNSKVFTTKSILSILLTCLIFAYLSFFEKIKTTFYTLYEGIYVSALIRFILSVGIVFILIFSALWNREKLFPLKYLSIELGTAAAVPQDQWKIYLDAGGYQEALSQAGKNIGQSIVFPMTSDLDFTKIRIDPGQSQQTINIKSIQLKSGLETVYTIEKNALFDQIKPLNQIKNIGFDAATQHVSFQAESGDPFFEIPINNQHFKDNSSLFEIIIALFLSLLSVLLFFNWQRIISEFKPQTRLVKGLFLLNGLIFLGQLLQLGDIQYIVLVINFFGLFLLSGKCLNDFVGFQTDSTLATILLSLALGIGVVLLPLYLTYSLNIPNGHYLSIGLALALSVIYLWTNKTSTIPRFQQSLNTANLRTFTFFNILFYILVSPIAGLLCPPLHDPAVISTVSNEISEAGFIKNGIHQDLWNYPPYLQLLVALLGKLSGLSTPKTILFLTNLMVIGSGFSFGLFWQSFFKNKYSFYLSTLLLLFIAPTIPSLYFTAGKNALIFSFFYWFLILALLPQLLDRKNVLTFKLGGALTLLVITAFQFHYSIVFIFPTLGLLFLTLLVKDISTGEKEIFRKYLGVISGLVLPGILFGLFAVFQLKQATHNEKNDLFYARTTLDVEQKKKAKLTNEINTQEEESTQEKNSKNISKNAPIAKKNRPIIAEKETSRSKEPRSAKKKDKKVKNPKVKEKRKNEIFLPTPTYLNTAFSDLLKNNSKDYSIFKYPIVSNLGGALLLLLFFFTKRKKEIAIVLLFALTILIINNSNIYNLVLYTEVLFFMVPLLTAGFLLNFFVEIIRKDKRYVYLFLAVLTIISIQQAIVLNSKYYEYKYYSALTQADLKAFNFIDENLIGKGHFVPLNVSNLSRFVPAQGDGSLYLNLSKTESLLSYVPSQIMSITSKEFSGLRRIFKTWKEEDGRNETAFIKRLKHFGVKYIYSGAFVPWGRQLPIERLKSNPNFSLIYDKEGVQIFEIN